jgi:hypothetical protein
MTYLTSSTSMTSGTIDHGMRNAAATPAPEKKQIVYTMPGTNLSGWIHMAIDTTISTLEPGGRFFFFFCFVSIGCDGLHSFCY